MEMPLCRVDAHAHVLPGLDDGPRSMEGALRLCQRLAREGVRAVVATPHLSDGRYPVTAERIRRGVAELSEACRRAGLALQILPGSEVRVHPELLDALDAGELVTVADRGRHLFLELPSNCVPPIEALVFELTLRGIRPVLCHPERQPGLWRERAWLAKFAEQGGLVQVAAPSLLRGRSSPVRRTAERWLREGIVHVVASDAHSVERRPPRLRQAVERLRELGGVGLARRVVETYPKQIVLGRPSEERPGAPTASWNLRSCPAAASNAPAAGAPSKGQAL